MNARTLAQALFGRTLRRYVVAVVFGGLGIGLVVVSLALVSAGAAQATSSDNGLGSAAVRTIQVNSYNVRGDARAVRGTDVTAISRLTGVEHVNPWTQAGATLIGPATASGTTSGTAAGASQMWVTPRIASVQPALTSGFEPTAAGEIVIGKAAASRELIHAGDRISVEYTRKTAAAAGEGVDVTWTVSGLFDDSVEGIDGPDPAYALPATVTTLVAAANAQPESWVATQYEYPQTFVEARDLGSVASVQTALVRQGFDASSLASTVSSLPRTVQLLQGLSTVLFVVMIAFLLVTGWSLATSITAAQRQQVGLLRALGWTKRSISRMFSLQMLGIGGVMGVAGSAVGLIVALVVGAAAAGKTVVGYRFPLSPVVPQPGWIVATALLPAVICVVAAGVPIVRASRISPDRVLRDF